jgi:hypothetical protein
VARAVFSSGTSQLTVAIGGWYAGDKGDKADVGREVAGRREDWMRCWKREGVRAFAQEERRDLVEFCMGLGQSQVEAHVTWKESTPDLTHKMTSEPRRACLDKTTPPSLQFTCLPD